MKEKRISKQSKTDFEWLHNATDEDIDFSDLPEIAPERFAKGIIRDGLKPVPPKKQLTLRIDDDVVNWFKSQGRGYQTRINHLLRAYMEAHAPKQRKPAATTRSVHK